MKQTNCHTEEAYRSMRQGDEAYVAKNFDAAARCYELAALNFDAAGLSVSAKMMRSAAKELHS